MGRQWIEAIHFIEDSQDEVFLTKLLFRKEKVGARLCHHADLESFRGTLARAGTHTPLLLLVDLNLPGMKGTDIIRSILAEDPAPPLIAGICSGSEDPADRLGARVAGARFFINKPLNRQALARICEATPELGYAISEDDVLDLYFQG